MLVHGDKFRFGFIPKNSMFGSDAHIVLFDLGASVPISSSYTIGFGPSNIQGFQEVYGSTTEYFLSIASYEDVAATSDEKSRHALYYITEPTNSTYTLT